MKRRDSNSENQSRQQLTLLLLLLRLVTLACAILVIVPYSSLGWFDSLQTIAGQQILRLMLLVLVVLQTGHWLQAERRGEFIVSAVLFAILLFELLHTVPLRPKQPESPPSMRVMTFNSQGQMAGSWISWMDQGEVDLGCIQEVRPGDIEYIREVGAIHGYRFLHVTFTSDSSDGIAVLSRIPFERAESIEVAEHNSERRILPLVHVTIDGVPLQVLGVHLASTPRHDKLNGVEEAWRLRERQVETLLEWVKVVDSPVLVLGDFNATPTDGIVRRIRGSLDDMWVSGGSGVGGTWPAGLAFLRIDMIFAHGFDGISLPVLNSLGASDHLSLSMTLHLDE